MRRKFKCSSFIITMVFVSILSFLIGCSSGGDTAAVTTPVVFVHGYGGSADQFETQAMRFASNGYPASRISGYEYNTTLPSGTPTTGFVIPDEILSELDAFIDAVLEQTGAAKVDLLGHSLGTAVCHAYLADATHAAKVAHYVNLDGQQSATPPGGVPTLALWAEITGTGREIGGATNTNLPGTTHVQAVSCVESFTAIYKFFNNDQAPAKTDILPGSSNNIELAGRILTFLTNAVPANLKLDIYEVNKDTGVRIRSTPDYSTSINADGNFKFTNATAGSNYEFYLTSTSDATSSHYYYEPFVRSDYLIRLKYLVPAGLAYLMPPDNHSNLIVIRNKEFIGDDTLSPNEDSLKVNGTELCAGVQPKGTGVGFAIANFIFDQGSDGVSSGLITSGPLASLPNIYGLDFYMRAANPPDSTIPIVLNGRYSGTGTIPTTQVVNVPNWQSNPDTITVQMWDY